MFRFPKVLFSSYGGEEDEESLGDNDSAFDAPVVSGCAGSSTNSRPFTANSFTIVESLTLIFVAR